MNYKAYNKSDITKNKISSVDSDKRIFKDLEIGNSK